jgi:hypothetical protein
MRSIAPQSGWPCRASTSVLLEFENSAWPSGSGT